MIQEAYRCSHRFYVLLLLTILSLSMFSARSEMNSLARSEPIEVAHHNSLAVLETHEPIEILSDADFLYQGWSGNGTGSNPFIIEMFSISTLEDCISISNTRSHFVIRECMLSSATSQGGNGILLKNVTNGDISTCSISSKTNAISVYESEDIVINDITASECFYGIRLNTTSWIIVNGSRISDMYIGIEIRYGVNVSLTECIATEVAAMGIFIVYSSDCTVFECDIVGNVLDGLHAYQSSLLNISQNDIYDNGLCGVVVNLCNNSLFYSNGIGWNGLNAIDNGIGNKWNNNHGEGNFWGDYIEGDYYAIPGSAQSCDYHPAHLIFGEAPDSLSYAESDANISISVYAAAFRPSVYQILVNGTHLQTLSWDGSNLTYITPIITTGVFNYTIILCDTWGHSVSITTHVAILDLVAPMINHPSDVMYMEGMTGIKLTWNASDRHPLCYEIFMNNLKIAKLQWSGSSIEVPIDGLSRGIYYFEIVVHDQSGNVASDVVMVTVIPNPLTTTTIPTSTNPEDQSPLPIIPVSAGFLFLIGSVVILVALLVNKGLLFSRKDSIRVSEYELD